MAPHRTDACDFAAEFAEVGSFHDVSVDPKFIGARDVAFFPRRGKRNCRDVAQSGVRSHRLKNFEARHSRHLNIEEDEVGVFVDSRAKLPLALQIVKRLLPVFNSDNVLPRVASLEGEDKEFEVAWIVFSYEDGAIHSRCLTGGHP